MRTVSLFVLVVLRQRRRVGRAAPERRENPPLGQRRRQRVGQPVVAQQRAFDGPDHVRVVSGFPAQPTRGVRQRGHRAVHQARVGRLGRAEQAAVQQQVARLARAHDGRQAAGGTPCRHYAHFRVHEPYGGRIGRAAHQPVIARCRYFRPSAQCACTKRLVVITILLDRNKKINK